MSVAANDRYVAGFLAGQTIAYCEMVSRGVRLAGQLDVPADACQTLAELISSEGCRCRVVSRDAERAAIWIYREPSVERLIEAFESTCPTPADVAIWGMGKILGYSDQDVMTFLTSTSVRTSTSAFPVEPSLRRGSGRRDSDTA